MSELNLLAKQLIKIFYDNTFCIIEDNRQFKSQECLVLIKEYLAFLDEFDIRSVMIVSSPTIDSLCLMYALIISNRTYIPLYTGTSLTLLKTYLTEIQSDMIFFDDSWINNNINNTFECDRFKSFHFFKNEIETSHSILPGMVFFSSGTTGLPKAIHYHFNVIANYLSWCIKEFDISFKDIFLITTEMSFIASLRPLFLPLFNSCKLVLLDLNKQNKLSLILSNICHNDVNILNITPSILNQIFIHSKHMNIIDRLSKIKLIFLSGEQINSEVIENWFNKVSVEVKFYNLYGATEYLVPLYKKIDCTQTQKEIQGLDHDRAGVEVKFTLEDNNIYSLMVAGEIATGYIDPKLNGQNFILDENKRYLKCADLFVNNNNLTSFYERKDGIIKRYGHKVCLSQIENTLKSSPFAFDCAAILVNDIQIVLVISSEKTKANMTHVKQLFSNKHPWYMQPDKYKFVKELPKTSSGKVDYPMLKSSMLTDEKNCITSFFSNFFPDGIVDENVTLLSIGLVSIDFIHLSEVILKSMGKWFDLSKIDESFRICDLSKLLYSNLTYVSENKNSVILSRVQQGIYRYELNKQSFGWHVHYIYYFRLIDGIDLKRLSNSIEETIDNNFMLSCKLQRRGKDFFYVRVEKPKSTKLRCRLSKNAKPEKFLVTNIYSERLVQIYIQARGLHYYLVLAYHHIAIDGWSAANIRNEIFSRYKGQFNSLWSSPKEEVCLLNNVNETSLLETNIDELLSVFQDIEVKNYNNLDNIFYDFIQPEHTGFSVSKNELQHYGKSNNIEGTPASCLFLLNLNYSLIEITKELSFLYSVSFSNRMQDVPFVRNLIMNMVTGLPLFISSVSKSYKGVAKDIENKLNIYFKYMDYNSIINFYKSPKIKEIQTAYSTNKYKIYYTYIGKTSINNYKSEEFIDWDKSQANIFLGGSGIIFLRVFDVGNQYIVNIGTRVNRGVHKALVNEFKKRLAGNS